MPVIRSCPFCRKGFLKSTYQMIEHVNTKHKSTVLKNSKSFTTLNKEKNSDLDTTLSPVLGDGKILYKGKYGNSLYEPHDMFNSVKNETIAVNLDANNLNTDDSVVSAIIDENPLHFNY
jgi:hypothetical protein